MRYDDLQVTVQTTVPWQRVADLLCTGLEGGYSNSWLHSFYLDGDADESPWYADAKLLAHGPLRIVAHFDDPKEEEGEGNGRKSIDRAAIGYALQLMASKFPRHYADFVQENDDAITGDVFLQCLILGDVVYG